MLYTAWARSVLSHSCCDPAIARAFRNNSSLKHGLKLLSLLLAVFAGAIVLTSCGGAVQSANNDTNPASTKVVIVVEENKKFTDVIGNPAMPYLNSLATQYAVGTNYFANDQPSLPNYFMLTTGQTVVQHTDTFDGVMSDDNIVRTLKSAGKTWKAYAENLPSVGYLGGDRFPYIKHHVPFVLFSDVIDDPAEQQNVVPFSQFATDLANGNLPDYSFIVPNNQNNSHDCPQGMTQCSMEQTLANSDKWLETNVGPVLNSPAFGNGILVITYDEADPSDTSHGGGRVAFVMAGANVKRGFQSTTFYQHEATLRMALKRLGINHFPGAAASAPEMDEFFTK